jgi:anaerobic selenocysteine-containing dehydrogenase
VPATTIADTDGKAPAGAADGLWLLSGGLLFLQGSLGNRGRLLPQLAKEARAFLHPDQARVLGVAAGEIVELEGPAGSIRLPAALETTVPQGSVFVPYAFAAVELNRLGAPSGAGLRVRARKAAVPAGVS